MFPPIKVELFNLEPSKPYVLLIDMSPVDKYRYKYQNSAWVKCFEEECSPTRLYIHPDSPALGSHWMNTVVSFYKLKLTNNQLDKQGHVSYSSPPSNLEPSSLQHCPFLSSSSSSSSRLSLAACTTISLGCILLSLQTSAT